MQRPSALPAGLLALILAACGGDDTSSSDGGVRDAALDARPPPDASKPDATMLWFDAAPDARFAGDGGGTGHGTVTHLTFDRPGVGTLQYRLFSPTLPTMAPRPLVIVLHPCTSTADGFAATTEYEKLGGFDGFFVAFPEQDVAADPFRCWLFDSAANQQRGAGEPGLIAGITADIATSHPVDPSRIYVIGLGNGGALAITMAATYPDLYAAVGSVGGCAFQVIPCLRGNPTTPGMTLGLRVNLAQGPRARVVPVFVMQGDSDRSVPPANAESIVQEWLWAADLADGDPQGSVPKDPSASEPGSSVFGEAYAIDHYVDRNGAPLIDRWIVTGLEGFWPGGPATADFTDPLGPPATDASWAFFRAHPMN